MFYESYSIGDLIYSNLSEIGAYFMIPDFYKDILNTWYNLRQNYRDERLLNESLWFNDNITIENKPIFWENWYQVGIKHVGDILDENQKFYAIAEMYKKYKLEINFLTHLQIRQAIPLHWRKKIMTLTAHSEKIISLCTKKCIIPLTNLKSRDLYWLQVSLLNKMELKDIPSIKKWTSCYPSQNFNWQNIFLIPFEVCTNTKLQTLQYRIIHRVITRKHWLFMAKVKDSPYCETCGADDTLTHFFFNCVDVKQLWLSLINWWKRISEHDSFELSEVELIFGVHGTTKFHHVINFIIILLKKYINDTKFLNQTRCFMAFLLILKQSIAIERDICYKNSKEHIFEERWKWLYEQL